MELKAKVLITIGLIFCGLFASCNYPLTSDEEAEPTVELSGVEILATTVAHTLSAFESQIAEPEETREPTATPLATSTPEDENQVQSYSYNTAAACYSAYLSSETISDYTVMDPDEDFTKTWTLYNSGTCSWYSGYQLVYVDGYQMSGDSPQYISSEISPGETVTFSVDLNAPSSEGTYTGEWQLQTSDGTFITSVTVTIVVDEDVDFSVTGVSFSSDESYSGSCPYTFTYSADITTSDEGNVMYYFVYSDGSTGSSITLDYDEADTQTVSSSWTLSSSGSYWVKVYIDEPNNQTFGTLNLTLNCESPTATPTTAPTATEDTSGEETSDGTE